MPTENHHPRDKYGEEFLSSCAAAVDNGGEHKKNLEDAWRGLAKCLRLENPQRPCFIDLLQGIDEDAPMREVSKKLAILLLDLPRPSDEFTWASVCLGSFVILEDGARAIEEE